MANCNSCVVNFRCAGIRDDKIWLAFLWDWLVKPQVKFQGQLFLLFFQCYWEASNWTVWNCLNDIVETYTIINIRAALIQKTMRLKYLLDSYINHFVNWRNTRTKKARGNQTFIKLATINVLYHFQHVFCHIPAKPARLGHWFELGAFHHEVNARAQSL